MLTLLVGIAALSAQGVPTLSFHEFTAGFQGLMQRSVPANGLLPHGAESMPGEPAQILAAANFLRDNILWSEVEAVKGRYNFSRTDALLAECALTTQSKKSVLFCKSSCSHLRQNFSGTMRPVAEALCAGWRRSLMPTRCTSSITRSLRLSLSLCLCLSLSLSLCWSFSCVRNCGCCHASSATNIFAMLNKGLKIHQFI